MRRFSLSVSSALLIALSAAACTSEGGSSAPQGQTAQTGNTAAIAQGLLADKDMIVIYRDQLPALAARANFQARATTIAALHAPLIASLNATKVRATKSFGIINALSTKLSPQEVDTLSARSEVLAVVPDSIVHLPSHKHDAITLGAQRGQAPSPSAALCNTLEPEALQATHTAYLDPTQPQAQSVIDGQGYKVTGRGVKVAVIADGLNPSDPGFVRTDGTSAFIDYQDFSGDPAGTPTAGAEIYGDASSVAAQDTPNGKVLQYDISTFVNAAHPLPSPCNIRVRGMAPDASLVGLKIFSANITTDSAIVQAIEYAVTHDGVDVINESFGSNPISDDTKDPVSLANAAAVAAGVTVTVSSGDAGSNNTLGSPSTASDVIAVGASNTWRIYQQVNEGLLPVAKGYVNGNISAFSSGGFAQRRARTVDLVAPGDGGWALCSPNTTLFTECVSYSGAPAYVQDFGGTSESAPITAGAAALVIQAYKSTHYGASPSPATVKGILTSTAQDIGAPSSEQGAGIIDTLRAVNMALSLVDDAGSPPPRGTGLLASPPSFNVTAQPNDILAREFDVTNTGTSFRSVDPLLQKIGPSVAGQSVTVNINALTTPTTYLDLVGTKRVYVTKTFTVPSGVDHLDAAIAYAGNPSVVAFALLDPSGKQTAYSVPQGAGEYGHVDVVSPVAGQWTAVFRTTATTGYTGAIKFTWAAENFVSAGIVFPPHVSLAPGQTAHFLAALETTSQAGDAAAAIRFGSDEGEIPFIVRTLIGVGATGGSFTGTLTGDNGRGDFPAQTFAFDVPSGLKDLGAKLTVSDSSYSLTGYLIDPKKNVLSVGSNAGLDASPLTTLQLNHADPEAGRWELVIKESASSPTKTSSTFNGAIEFDKVNIKAPALPDSKNKKISLKKGLTVPVTIKNTSPNAKLYFADARLSPLVQVALPTYAQTTPGTTLPNFYSIAVVPPRAQGVAFIGQSTVPIDMEASWVEGDPDLFGKQVAPNTMAATLLTPEAAYGVWALFPALRGPFGPAGAPTEAITTTAYALMPNFDPAVSSDTGNLWADQENGTSTFAGGLEVDPGQTGTITLTITPDAAAGQVVKGFVSIDTYDPNNQDSLGDEVITLPYAYTVAP